MAISTATPARIRLCKREFEYVKFQDATIRDDRPDAQDNFDSPIRTFFDDSSDAQAMLDERKAVFTISRLHEAAETNDPLDIGAEIVSASAIPLVRIIDEERSIDREMILKGISIDHEIDRNSLEAVG